MRVLLDTNAYSAFKRGHPDVVSLVRHSREVLLSTVVAGELLYGFRCGSRFERHVDELEQFAANAFVRILPVTMTTADRFARVAAALRAKGKPIPTNDMWIAAQTMESGAELLSFDEHYASVDGLAWRRLQAS
jgi:tRNA(fMet)-specific endonuclease VapC